VGKIDVGAVVKVLFSNPPWWVRSDVFLKTKGMLHTSGVRAGSRWPFTTVVHSKPDQPYRGDYTPYPFFLGYAATYAAKHTDAEVIFRDSIALKDSYNTFVAYVKEQKPDYLVIESASPSWEHDSSLIKRMHKAWPEMKIIVAGPIASMADKVLQRNPVHACIKGEYEKGVVRVLNGQEGIVDFDLLTKKEMNEAPFPWYDDAHAYQYCDAGSLGGHLPHAHVWSSRGCPYKCIFCVWPATMTGQDPDGTGNRSVRHYSQDYMEAFLTQLKERYNYSSFYFDDDTFNLGNRHVRRMCEVMRKLKMPWSAMCRADTIDMEVWDEMRASGCFGVKLGFESGNQFVVDKIVNKKLDLEYSKTVVRHLHSIGMKIHGTFTFGLPGETKEQMQDTQDFIDSLPFDSVQRSGTAEIEGTPLATLSKEGALPAYEAATIDENYQISTDGKVKWHQLARD
jgi:radical SAM superfamily enzyme YgiQ (UPF0313 family)